jgi:uncharacterized membrane protein
MGGNKMFCKYCGNEIHEDAVVCIKCGRQVKPIEEYQSKNTPHWSSITSFIAGIIVIIIVMTEPSGRWSSDTIAGVIILGTLPIIFGVISLSKKTSGRWMAITGLVLGCITVLASLGSL